jgi:hypothetical protein
LIAGASTKYQNLRDFQQRGGAPHECTVWDISNLPQMRQIGRFCSHTGGVSDIVCIGDYIVSLGLDNCTAINDAVSLQQIQTFNHHAPPSCFLTAFGSTCTQRFFALPLRVLISRSSHASDLGGYNSITPYIDPTIKQLDANLSHRIKTRKNEGVLETHGKDKKGKRRNV